MISFIKVVNCLFLILASNVVFDSSIIIDFELPDFKLSYKIPQSIEPNNQDEIDVFDSETIISSETSESS